MKVREWTKIRQSVSGNTDLEPPTGQASGLNREGGTKVSMPNRTAHAENLRQSVSRSIMLNFRACSPKSAIERIQIWLLHRVL